MYHESLGRAHDSGTSCVVADGLGWAKYLFLLAGLP